MVRMASETTDFPPLVTQAQNLFRSARGFVRSGFKLASKLERARRLEICRVCPKYVGNRCSVCGCASAAKTWVASDRCPLDPPKWSAVTD
jgi:hypothetical protein